MEKQFLKRVLALCCIAVLAVQCLHAEAFKVKKFRAELELDKNGVLIVKEIIDVFFFESKHGLIRKLPFRFSPIGNVDGEIAEGHSTKKDYFTPIREVQVIGQEFSTQENGYDLSIKIGSANEYVVGDQQYIIQYKVYGVINRFKNSQEFYWNVNGNDWDVSFEEVEAQLKLPDGYRLPAADVRTFNGYRGESKTGCEVQISPGKLNVSFKRELLPGEGVTFVTRFPSNYFKNTAIPLELLAKNHVIDSLVAYVQLNDSGYAAVEEWIWLHTVKPGTDFERVLSKTARSPMPEGRSAPSYAFEILPSSVQQLPAGTSTNFRPGKGGLYYQSGFEKMKVDGSYLADSASYLVKLRYIIWHTVTSRQDTHVLFMPWLIGQENEPIGMARMQLAWSQNVPPQLSNLIFHPATPKEGRIALQKDNLNLSFQNGIKSGDIVQFSLHLAKTKFDVAPKPMRLESPDNYIKNLDAKVSIQENGKVHYEFKALWLLRNRSNAYFRLSDQIDRWNNHVYAPRFPQKWGASGYYLLENMQSQVRYSKVNYCDLGLNCYEFTGLVNENTEVPQLLDFSYDIYGLLDLENQEIGLPLFEGFDAPIEALNFELNLPGNLLLNSRTFSIFLDSPYLNDKLLDVRALQFEPGRVSGKVYSGIFAENAVSMVIEVPPGSFQSSFWLETKLFLYNHHYVIYPFLYALLLGILWAFFGRDKKFPVVVQFYPPEGMDPVDAGVLIDARLDDRDIMALIYWWGARGLLTIEEIYGTDGEPNDYKLSKLANLPDDAKSYEKTLFNGLFGGSTETKILQHRNSFHHTLAKVRKEIAKEHQSKRLFVPGTEAWLKVMKIIGWGLFILGLIILIASMNGYGSYIDGRVEIPLGFMAMAGLTFLVRRQMPKKTPFGQAQFEILAGFEEFLILAEKEKLEELVNTNPDYFGLTLPYAIALGLAGAWTDRFGPLLTKTPSYYRGSLAEDRIRDRQFDLVLQRQLGMMARILNSAPAPSRSSSGSSGGSSYRSSSSFGSSSRSYSSSGSSGRSGFSSRGGYSGGGYGGGGGSSW